MRQRTAAGARALALAFAVAIVAAPAASGQSKSNSIKASQLEPGAPGSLGSEDLALDCRRMAGRMQIRILELRGASPVKGSSTAAQGLQSTAVSIFGGSRHGADAAGERTGDLAKLRAMNAHLIAKQCPHYDLDAELSKTAGSPGPKLIRSKGPAPAKR